MFQPQLMQGQRILVTGGGTGLGQAMAEKFLELGADVAICGRRKAVCDETAEQWRTRFPGQRVDTFGVDIRVAPAVDEMVEALFQSGGLTGLINNAAGNFIAPTESLSARAFDAIANIVFHGSFYVTQAVGKRWVEQAKAGAWQRGQPFRNVMSIITTWVDNGSPYVVPSAMSKAGIEVMTKAGSNSRESCAVLHTRCGHQRTWLGTRPLSPRSPQRRRITTVTGAREWLSRRRQDVAAGALPPRRAAAQNGMSTPEEEGDTP